MRKLLYISFVYLLVTVVMSCSRGVDKRLVLADTLMWTNPDSSLAILEKIDSKSLKGKENQAYYALLLTQAQFRCNIPLTSDTLISKAVDYYSDNHNR
ncbi:MAG: tetratricopeptide repeat protein, partial [Muribaculaceae bacterium]|nr:tetratricopeptide repeat protein [Muribaculaceae bacterium]